MLARAAAELAAPNRATALLIAMFIPLLGGCPTYGPGGEKDACVTCHEGIEQAHPEIPAERCSVCHGGDATKLRKELAHVPIPEDWAEIRGPGLPPAPEGFIRGFAPDQLDAIADHLDVVANPTLIFAGPKALANLEATADSLG